MAPTSWSPFAEDIQELCKIIRRFNPPAKPNENFTTDVGLRVLIQLSQDNSNVVVAKTTLKLSKPASKNHQTFDSSSSFLKSCHLCKSKLRLDRDIFMYRGDQGFCSVECRNRQIYLDERKETEVSTKKVKSTLRHCQPESDAYCETRALLEQFRQRHDKPRSHQNRRVTLAREVM